MCVIINKIAHFNPFDYVTQHLHNFSIALVQYKKICFSNADGQTLCIRHTIYLYTFLKLKEKKNTYYFFHIFTLLFRK